MLQSAVPTTESPTPGVETVRVDVLASGSSANAMLLRFGDRTLLVDAGLEHRPLISLLNERAIAPQDLDGVLLTHEHMDHIRGLAGLVERCPSLPIYATPGTAAALAKRTGVRIVVPNRPASRERLLIIGKAIHFGGVRVIPFNVSHDARQPVGFRFDYGDFSMGHLTDVGRPTRTLARAVRGCRVLCLEANHSLDMLRWGPYPEFLKQRVASKMGHLSNAQAAELLREVAHRRLEHVVLIHLSAKNNTPERALDDLTDVRAQLPWTKFTVAARDEASKSLSFGAEMGRSAASPLAGPVEQLSLFD